MSDQPITPEKKKRRVTFTALQAQIDRIQQTYLQSFVKDEAKLDKLVRDNLERSFKNTVLTEIGVRVDCWGDHLPTVDPSSKAGQVLASLAREHANKLIPLLMAKILPEINLEAENTFRSYYEQNLKSLINGSLQIRARKEAEAYVASAFQAPFTRLAEEVAKANLPQSPDEDEEAPF